MARGLRRITYLVHFAKILLIFTGQTNRPALNAVSRFIKTVPPWAFVVVLVVIFVQTANMYYLARLPVSGERENLYDGHWIIDYVKPGGAVDKAGIRLGDTIVSCNGYSVEEWYRVAAEHSPVAGDTLIFGILRIQVEVGYPVIVNSFLSLQPGIYWTSYLIFILLSIAGLYILFRKPEEPAVKIYFIYIQLFVVGTNGGFYQFSEAVAFFIGLAFIFCTTMASTTLVHFHLIFPQPARYFSRYKRLPLLVYSAGFIIFLFQAVYIYQMFFGSNIKLLPIDFIYVGLCWGTIASILAIALAIFQLVTIKDTLARKQLRIIVIGTIAGSLFGIFYAFFYDYVNELLTIYLNLSPFSMKAGGLILITCLLIAIFRYRIWEMEIVLKKVLLYLLATTIIILSYLALLYLVDLFTLEETKTTRFVSLALSVLLFLVLRDRMQKLVERIFHRESYDSAAVVSEFEEGMALAYRIEDIGSRILDRMDDIFHFRSVILYLNKEKLTYEAGFVMGAAERQPYPEFQISDEFENKLLKARVFSPGELSKALSLPGPERIDLVVPMVKDGRPFGFFLCGPKKSEKAYSMQDIRVLSLIAKRVIALFQTASLYQSDLDRQLMLERERARIAQDMHDDIGAGLTKIAMISESMNSEKRKGNNEKGTEDKNPGTLKPWNSETLEPGTNERERMQKVATTAREMINRLNVIVWALNPRYDNLESLVSYARRYFGEYLENFDIGFRMEVPDDIPDIPVTPDFRRNAFYAWQEAVHNAVKHGQCSEIHFDIRINNQKLFVTISDNGKGFDQVKQGSGGNGLLNMKKRAEEMGGTFEITSAVGKGTKVSFIVNLA